MSAGDVNVYALICPLDKKIKYIGVSANLERRLKQHISTRRHDANKPKGEWITKLVDLGLKPELSTVEAVHYGNYTKRESFWINYCFDNGIELLNIRRS